MFLHMRALSLQLFEMSHLANDGAPSKKSLLQFAPGLHV